MSEVEAQAPYLIDGSSSTSAQSINLTFCIDAEYWESATLICFIPDAEEAKSLNDSKHRKYLDNKATES